MTVKQLIEELKQYSPNADVFVESEEAWDTPSITVDEDGQVIISMEYYGIRKETHENLHPMNWPDGTCNTCKHLSTIRDKMTGNCICTQGGVERNILSLDHGCMWYDYFLSDNLNAEHRKEQK